MVVMLCSYSATANTTLILSTCSLLFFSQFLVIFFFSCLAWLSFPFYFLLFRQTQQNVVQLSTRCCEMVNITFFARKMLFSLKRWLVCFSFYAIVVSTFSSWAICISIMRAAFPEKSVILLPLFYCRWLTDININLVSWRFCCHHYCLMTMTTTTTTEAMTIFSFPSFLRVGKFNRFKIQFRYAVDVCL